jgi:SAM-dependent methyltransferase
MPTLPSEPHQARQWAESFGSDAERYNRSRPRYPDALVQRIAAASPGPDLLDVGIGTGIAARQFEALGCRVSGVDVDTRMAAYARRFGFPVDVAKFEDWDPAGRDFDAIVAGQTWHWIDPVAGAAKAATVLRPGGRLAVFWNIAQPPPPLAAAFAGVYDRVLPGSPRNPWASHDGYATLLDKAAEGIRSSGAFEEPEQWEFAWARAYTKDEWLDQIPTGGNVVQFPPGKLDELLAGLGEAAGDGFTMQYTAVVVTARLRR